MAANTDELEQLRQTLEAARQQGQRDHETIGALEQELRDQRRETLRQVRNILSVVRSIARRTAEEDETAEEYQLRLDSRLASFTRLQNAILRNPSAGVELCTLVSDELLAFGISPGDRADVEGDQLFLKPRPASMLGLAFHELARIAVEDGASANLDGRIDVSWTLDADGEVPRVLRIAWTETGRRAGPGLRRTSSFGRDVLEQAVAYELGGSVLLDVTNDGVDCRFELPAECLASSIERSSVRR